MTYKVSVSRGVCKAAVSLSISVIPSVHLEPNFHQKDFRKI